MTTPHLSPPVIFHPSQLKSDPSLTTQIINLTNEAFRRSKRPDPKWNTRPRFQTLEQYYEMLVDQTIVAVIFDQNAEIEDTSNSPKGSSQGGESSGKVVACAAAVPWTGGWKKEGAGTEDGWEIKAIAVNGDSRYLRTGLAVQVMTSLERRLAETAKKQLQISLPNGTGSEKSAEAACLTFWILAAECINGSYWRRRGYREVRRTTEGNGTWGCQTSFDLVVFRKDVEYDMLV